MGGRGPAQPHRQAAGPARSHPSAMEETEGRAQSVAALPERCTTASAGLLPSFTPIHQRGRGREREGRKEGGREGGGGWRAGPGPGEGEGRAAGGLLSRSGARALAQRSRVLSLAPERSPPAPPRSLDSRVAARSLPHSLSRPPDSAAAPPLQLRLSQELPQRPDVTAPPPPQTRQEEGGERRARGACAGRAGPGPGPRALLQGELEGGPQAGGQACDLSAAFLAPLPPVPLGRIPFALDSRLPVGAHHD